jgi:hypothetical protein
MAANFNEPLRLGFNARITPNHHNKLEEIRQRLEEEERKKRSFKRITKYMTMEKIIDMAHEIIIKEK